MVERIIIVYYVPRRIMRVISQRATMLAGDQSQGVGEAYTEKICRLKFNRLFEESWTESKIIWIWIIFLACRISKCNEISIRNLGKLNRRQ